MKEALLIKTLFFFLYILATRWNNAPLLQDVKKKTCQSRGLAGNTCALKFWDVVLIWTIKFRSGLYEFYILFYPSFPLSLYRHHTLFLISKNTLSGWYFKASVFEYKQNLKILYKHPPWKRVSLKRTQLIK